MVQANGTVRVIIADRQPLFRHGIRSSLKQLPDIEVYDEADSAQELLSTLNVSQPDVVLLHTELSFSVEPDLARTIKQMLPSVAVVLLTPKPNDSELFQAIRSRAAGSLQRDVTADELALTIRKSADGHHPINESDY